MNNLHYSMFLFKRKWGNGAERRRKLTDLHYSMLLFKLRHTHKSINRKIYITV